MSKRKVTGKKIGNGRQAKVARLSDTGLHRSVVIALVPRTRSDYNPPDVVVLVRDTMRPGNMSVEVLTTWEDGEKLFYAAIEGDESGWLVKGYEGELVATRSRNARDESIRLVKAPLRTLA